MCVQFFKFIAVCQDGSKNMVQLKKIYVLKSKWQVSSIVQLRIYRKNF